MNCNQTVICGKIIEIGSLRYTPAGVAVTEFKISHVSRQIEADKPRQVECEISAVALAQMAEAIASIAPDTLVKLVGFLAKKSRMSLQLVLHVNKVDLI
ncbi:primosomal replication protein N [Nitrosospira sp. NRS527]|uniref:primosomal replication protein N n=1 Tax=Nitrosospira sp. NRS527 TaxID=155925 RepID=UPI001AF08987|nr:primosomal replication protein N [Nitrosospira sp. NRS527]BCT68532.1 Primosomal replication protein N [Nitrosospira sp. NRS527]